MMRCFCSTGWSGFPHTGEERQEVKDKSVLGPPLFPPVVNPFPFHPFLLALGPFLFLLPFQQLHLWPIVRLFSSFLFISSCFIYLLLLLLLLFLFLISHLLKKKKMLECQDCIQFFIFLSLPFSWDILSFSLLLLMSSFNVKLECLSTHFASILCACFFGCKVTKDISRGFPLTWQTPRNLLSFLFIFPNALGCAGIHA